MVDDPVPLAFESWQAADRNGDHVHPQAEANLQFTGHPFRGIQTILDLQTHRIETLAAGHGESVFHDLGKAADDIVDGGRKDVDASDDEHVIHPPEHATIEPHPRAPAGREIGRAHV